MIKRAVVPGTFDPITCGHLDVIERAAGIFDELVVGVAASEHKNGVGTLFTLEERIGLVRAATAHLPHVQVDGVSGLLVDFVRAHGAAAVVKGLRALTDFEHEFQMAALNWRMDADFETLFIMAAPEYMFLSSSAVKEVARLGGRLDGLVPPQVLEPLGNRFATDGTEVLSFTG